MAVPGMQKLNIPQTGSAKATIATNLSNKTAATGNNSRSNFVSSNTGIFSATSVRTNNRNTNAPGFAQRTAIGSGEHLNWKTYNSGIISGTRHAVNDFRTPTFNNINLGNVGHAHNCNSGSTLDKIAGYLALAGTLAKLGVETANAFKSDKTNEPNDPALKNLENQKTSAPKSLTDMKKAKDSSTLRAAIETAEASKPQMEAELKNIESELPSMKEASETATKQLEGLKEKLKGAEDNKATAEKNVKTAQSNTESSRKSLENAKNLLTNSTENLENAKNSFLGAKSDLRALQNELSSIPQTLEDGTSNPNYETVKAAVAKAEENVKMAEANLGKAADEYNNAKSAEQQSADSYKNTAMQLAKFEENLAKRNEELKTANKEFEEANKQLGEAQGKINDYNNALKKQTELKSGIASLEKEIPAQKKRLSELETKEQRGLGAAENTILQMQNKLAGKDGIVGNEDDKKKLGSRSQSKMDNAKNLQRNVSYTNLYKTAGETINGKTFRTGSYNGETLYMIGAKKVDEATFNRQKTLAGNVQNDKNEINKKFSM